MRNSQITIVLSDCIAAIEDGGSANADFAIAKLDGLIRALRPPEPTLQQQEAVLRAMQAGHTSAVAIQGATGLKKNIIYPARYALLKKNLVFNYDNGLGPTSWGCDPL